MIEITESKSAMSHEKELELTVTQDDIHHRRVLGRDAEELHGYWSSWRLIGSVLAIALMSNSLFVGYAMPVNVLSIINADIGQSLCLFVSLKRRNTDTISGPSPNIYLVTTCFTLVSGVLLLVVGRLR